LWQLLKELQALDRERSHRPTLLVEGASAEEKPAVIRIPNTGESVVVIGVVENASNPRSVPVSEPYLNFRRAG
jgi:hypothetical protein